MPAPSVLEDRLVFTLDDPGRRWARVALDCDDAIGPRHLFRRTRAGWALRIPRPDLRRVEYRLVLTDRVGETTVECDPGNPERVRTAFGERSVALMPGYERPSWLQVDAAPGSTLDLVHPDDELGDLPIALWCPAGLKPDRPAPLLVVHDGPEYACLADLTRYAAAMVDQGTLPPFRMALMQPVERDEWYAANEDYLTAELAALDMVETGHPSDRPPVVMGASLGGLCALLLALEAQPRFAGVFSQSGSFFAPDLDEQESSYPYFEQITAAVAQVGAAAPAEHPLTVGLTCGAMEENHANNAAMADVLTRLGHDVRMADVPDLHNYTAWRDSLHPTLTDVLRSAWGTQG
jgi:enterochelin esterase family protein